MSKPFCLIDSSMTLHGLAFDMAGARMERFLANPIMLYMHVRGRVIGRWNNVRLTAQGYLGDDEYDQGDELAKEVSRKVSEGFLKACSAGVVIYKIELVNDIPTATDWEPFEVSIVDAGSNAHALRLCNPDGEWIEDSENHIKNLTLSIMSTEKKQAGQDGAPVTVAVPKGIALAVGLAEDATEVSVLAKITELTAANTSLTDKVKQLELTAETNQKNALKELLDSAISKKKIPATQRTHFETLAAANFDSVKAIIDAIPEPVNLVDFAKNGSTLVAEADENLAAEYTKLDKEGKLEKLKEADPDKFKKLYAAKFGKEPA